MEVNLLQEAFDAVVFFSKTNYGSNFIHCNYIDLNTVDYTSDNIDITQL